MKNDDPAERHTADSQLEALLANVAAVSVPSDERPLPPLPVGSMLGPFRLVDVAGIGGMGVVYRAVDERLQREVALKVLPDEGQHRLLDEARAAAAIQHPNIASVYEAGLANGRAYFAMELVRGQPLRALMRESSATFAQRLEWAERIAQALAAIHAQHWLHLDVKPENVMVTASGELKLLDFGLARPNASTVDTRAGTPRYMAPEQRTGGVLTPRTDVYAFGLLLEELLTGAPRRLAHRVHAVSAKCVAVNADERWSSGAEVAEALSLLRREAIGLPARWWFALAAIAVTAGAIASFTSSTNPEQRLGPSRRLTGHLLDRPISAAAVSGDTFAYVDDLGLMVGELEHPERAQRVELPEPATWVTALPGGDWAAHTASALLPGGGAASTSVWRVDGAGHATLLKRGAFNYAAYEPHTQRLAVLAENTIRIERASTGEPVGAVPGDAATQFCGLSWSPNGAHLAVSSVKVSSQGLERAVEVWRVGDEAPRFSLRTARLAQAYAPVVAEFAESGELLYALAETPGTATGSAVWAQSLTADGRAAGAPVRLATFENQFIASIGQTSAGALLTVRHEVRAHAVVAKLTPTGALGPAHTLTTEAFDERPTAWASNDALWLMTFRDLVPHLARSAPAATAFSTKSATWPVTTGPERALLYWQSEATPTDLPVEWSLLFDRDRRAVELPFVPREPLAVSFVPPFTAQVRCASKQEACVLATNREGVVTLWQLALTGGPPRRLFELPGRELFFQAWQLDPSGTRVVVAQPDSTVVTYRLDGSIERKRELRSLQHIRSLALTDDPNELYAAGVTGTEHRLVHARAETEQTLRNHDAIIFSDLAVSPDGRALAFSERTFDTDLWLNPTKKH